MAVDILNSLEYQPRGFTSCARNVGIRDSTLDFSVVASVVPASAAAMFTRSLFCGAPIIVGREHVANGRLQAVVVTSKNANVATGQQGVEYAREITRLVAQELAISPTDVLPSSTGVIGRQLPMDRIRAGITGLKRQLVPNGLAAVSEAILTTDTRPKVRCASVGKATLSGMCKGVGMIEPDMATMLAFFYTDAAIPPQELSSMLRDAVTLSFNMVSVDTDTSTSDTCAILANGQAGAVDRHAFADTLTAMARELAQEVARDGEGATKLITVTVAHARDGRQAKRVAKAIVNSPLVKTMIYGADPNWGRIAMAIGKCHDETDIQPDRVRIAFGDIVVYDGRDLGESRLGDLKAYVGKNEVAINVVLHTGDASATVWGCDLTEGYVDINGKYST